MRSIREIFVIGHGPSSSHTMGPAFACDYILNKYPNPDYIRVNLYGSLAKTGKGHLTDYVIDLKLKDIPHEIVFDYKTKKKHPNTLIFYIKSQNKEYEETIISIGGGSILTSDSLSNKQETYPHSSLKEILDYCQKEDLSLINYVLSFENKDIFLYLDNAYQTMKNSIKEGIRKQGFLPGNLKVRRKAKSMYEEMMSLKENERTYEMKVGISSFAVSEENASGGIICIAPTCGSAGVIPGIITYLEDRNYTKDNILKGFLVAGLIGILAKTNASISGAECGCQAEIGVACSMGAAMIAACEGLDNDNIAQSAEIALEHSLGLTCDPVDGYVQIPCIERCALFALKAVNAVSLAKIIPSEASKISFDDSLKTMYETGKDLRTGYKETASEGLARLYKNSK